MPSPAWAAFKRAVTRWEREKIQPATALRNTAGVMLPLAAAALLGQPSIGLVMALGALNVAYSDGIDPYPVRARRMLLSTFFCSLAVLVGGLAGQRQTAAALAAIIWAFGAGLIVTLGTTAADVGTISLVTLVVFAARPLDWKQSAVAALLAAAGGILQTVLSLLFCRVGRYEQSRRVLAGIFGQLSLLARTSTRAGGAPLATAEFTQARESLRAQNRDHGPHAEAFSALLSQAERMRLRLLTLGRLHRRLARDAHASGAVLQLDLFRQNIAHVTDTIQQDLTTSATPTPEILMDPLEKAAAQMRQTGTQGLSTFSSATARDAVVLMDSINGQLRSALRLQAPASAPNKSPRRHNPTAIPFFQSRLQVLEANLSFRSVAFRHAVRLATCIGVGEAISTTVNWQRSYWIPMTIAIVLKPDFLSTISRGALRLAGTFVGLIVATAIYHVAPASAFTDMAVVGLFTLMLRGWGPANYALLSLSVSAIVVALIAGTGVAPRDVILLRGMNTAIGGVIAMLAYALWPTWERAHFGESLAHLLNAYRAYLRGVRAVYVHPEAPAEEELDRVRQGARVARTNAEASADRLGTEPGTTPRLAPLATAILAASHNFIYAAMTLESGVLDELEGQQNCLPVLRDFLDHVDLMLYFLAATLTGSNSELQRMYRLRERYRALSECFVQNGLTDSLIQVEADRMTNALNTLRDQVLEWKHFGRGPMLDNQ